ncbi:MAG: hypothetical protein GEU93_16440 [Propionibacteriales bacterium]|nr:hypothetical protein [Propionibacteriales bacterium]
MSLRIVHIARIPVLVAVFAAVGPPTGELLEAQHRLDSGAYWGPGAQMVILGAVFVAVSLFDRQRRHSWAVLVTEAVVAAVWVLPPFLLITWFGVSFTGWTTFNDFSRALAITWLVIAVTTLARQVRRVPASLDAGTGPTPGSHAG